ncbi:MAG: carbamoyltransferase HypF [Chloroflexi bacterium]|nr:carbamoyltransferase HypF [Chloroflexota bacterium]
MNKTGTVELARISARGVVQGVGFRPFIYQLATSYGLAGWVCNTSEDVKIEVQGEKRNLECFLKDLEEKAPPLAHIEDISGSYHPPADYTKFEIRHSIAQEGKYQLVSPDIATCQACRQEISDEQNRRYRYPFTNCTNCGPRFIIIEDIPYDRPNTTMRSFQMCPQCQAEYDNPLDRRFHAQPNACPKCGPQLELLDVKGKPKGAKEVIATAVRLLKEGKILAIKGLGGYLLACNATSQKAVELLRQRKRRPFKPLAIMVADIAEARKHCQISADEERLLSSTQSPIVLLWRKPESTICQAVAPNLKYLGVMLPYTPLHHILIRETGLPLVMTSGNLSEEPIAKDNDEALRRLVDIADYFLVHNRDIYSRYDDSVTLVEIGSVQLTRRARGYAPYPVRLPFHAREILACGAEEKSTFCLTRDNYAFVSQHIGDLENLETMEHFETTLELYKKLFRIQPEIVAYDMHPEYLSTKFALELAEKSKGVRLVPVQHHHAHIASCLADNGLESPVIGVSLDGTGYGTDGRIWGGEFLVADFKGFNRMGHLEYLPLPGGAAAIKKPYRIAIGYLLKLLGGDALSAKLDFLKQVDPVEIDLIKRQIQTGLNSPLTSSMGRLFDAISALIGMRGEIDYDAHAAIELEMIAYDADVGDSSYPYSVNEHDGVSVVQLKELMSAIVLDLQQGVPQAEIAARFHNTVASMIGKMCEVISAKTGIKQVALSGGVFQNRLLLRKAVPSLKSAGFSVLMNRQVPCNDGGISLGQAAIANYSDV